MGFKCFVIYDHMQDLKSKNKTPYQELSAFERRSLISGVKFGR